MAKINATSIALTHTLSEVNRKIAEIEERQSRADTLEAALHDAYMLQEYQAARQKLAAGVGKLGNNVSFLGFPKK